MLKVGSYEELISGLGGSATNKRAAAAHFLVFEKTDAKNEFGRSLESRGNYSFGGRTPIADKRKNSALPSKYFIDSRGVMRMAANNPSKSFKTFSGPINPFDNIYELVQ